MGCDFDGGTSDTMRNETSVLQNNDTFLPEIREMRQYGTLVNSCIVITIQVNESLKKQDTYVSLLDNISLVYHMMVGTFRFGTTGSNKGIKISYNIELLPFGW